MKKTVLVTGGTGYIGSWIVKGLLENGHSVRLPVRDKNRKEKYQYLVDFAGQNEGSLEVWEANLLDLGSFDEMAKGSDAIVHVASPFMLNVKDAKKDLLDPAVIGTTNILEAARKSKTVKKVVLTSSAVAIYGDNIDMAEQNLSAFTEEQHNTSSSLKHQPYAFSKVEGKKAWEMAGEQSDWELIVLNPSFVMGPSLTATSQSESLKFMHELLSGKQKFGSAELDMGYVDVRDVAQAHVFCVENKASGRHILSERVTDMLSLVQIVRKLYGDRYKLPKSYIPKWILGLIGGLFGLSPKYVKNNVGIPLALDATKSKEKMQLRYIPLEQTVRDMVDQMETNMPGKR